MKSSDPESWHFDQSPDCAVITLRSIIFGGRPILRVEHNADDHGWQFLGLEELDVSDAAVVGLATIVRHDPSIVQLADLPPGWHAWRESADAVWKRAPTPDEQIGPQERGRSCSKDGAGGN